jgi:hypothetical protein
MKTISAHTKSINLIFKTLKICNNLATLNLKFKFFALLSSPLSIFFSLSEAFQAYQNGNISLFVIAMSAFCLAATALYSPGGSSCRGPNIP